jgi:uncharacterized protein YbjT (DUF2867 family)
MTNQKVILVTGATGAQGGSVARHLLKGGEFRVRALTRNPESAKAAALRQAGAEVVKGDLGDFRSVRAAVEGCDGVFGVTNYWEHFDQEYQHGKNLVDAVKGAEVEHFVFSGLPHVKALTSGALEVPHFDRKGEIEEYARQVRPGSTFVHVAFYYDNFLASFPLKDQGNGTYGFGFPQGDTPLAGVAVDDIGGVVAAIFARPLQFRDKTVGIVGDDLPPAKLAEIMTRVLGKKVVYSYVPREVFASYRFPGADDLANMFEFNRLYIRSRKTDLAESRSLYPAIQSFETWLQAHKGEFHLEPEVARGTAG